MISITMHYVKHVRATHFYPEEKFVELQFEGHGPFGKDNIRLGLFCLDEETANRLMAAFSDARTVDLSKVMEAAE